MSERGSGVASSTRVTCTRCGEQLEEGSLFCQACGAQAESADVSFADEERPRPWFAILTAIWLLLMIAALVLLLTNAIQVGSA